MEILSSTFISKLLQAFNKRQHEINRQMEECDKKFQQKLVMENQLVEKVEKEFFLNRDEKLRQTENINSKILLNFDNYRAKDEESKKTGSRSRLEKNGTEVESLDEVEIVISTNRRDFENNVEKLQTLIKEAGFSIVEQSGNCIKVALR